MRLTGTQDTDIRIDRYGQPMADNNGESVLCSGMACWMQDIWIEMLTGEGELLWEDREGRLAYGYSLYDSLNAEYDAAFDAQMRAVISEKLTKRDYIDESSIRITTEVPQEGTWAVNVQFAAQDGSSISIDIIGDGEEVYVT